MNVISSVRGELIEHLRRMDRSDLIAFTCMIGKPDEVDRFTWTAVDSTRILLKLILKDESTVNFPYVLHNTI